jgi:hypothetical protein
MKRLLPAINRPNSRSGVTPAGADVAPRLRSGSAAVIVAAAPAKNAARLNSIRSCDVDSLMSLFLQKLRP